MTSGTDHDSDVTGELLTRINNRILNLEEEARNNTDLAPSLNRIIGELEKLLKPVSTAAGEGVSKGKILGSLKNETAKVEIVDDLLSLIYLGSMFDLKSHNDGSVERDCFFILDCMNDDPVKNTDMDILSDMSALLISRPADSSISHQNALKNCIKHAKLWIEKSEKPISSNSNVTYASVREKLAKIMKSDYYLKIQPEMKSRVNVAAELDGNYAFNVPQQQKQQLQTTDYEGLREMMQGLRFEQQEARAEMRYRLERIQYSIDWGVHNTERFFEAYPDFRVSSHTIYPGYGDPGWCFPFPRYDQKLALRELADPGVDDVNIDDVDGAEHECFFDAYPVFYDILPGYGVDALPDSGVDDVSMDHGHDAEHPAE